MIRITIYLFFSLFAIQSFALVLNDSVFNSNLKIHKITLSYYDNIYVIENNGKLLMIDAGIPKKEKKIERKLRKIGIAPKNIQYILITHGHFDHVGAAQYFQKKYGSKIIAGLADKHLYSSGEIGTVCTVGFMAKIIKATFPKEPFPTFAADYWIDSDTNLKSLNIDCNVYITSSHTHGSLIFQFGEHLFVGDLIRGKMIIKKKPAYSFFECDLDANIKDIKKIIQLKCKYWYPGHFGKLSSESINDFIIKKK